MKITRLDGDREVDKPIKAIDIELENGVTFHIREIGVDLIEVNSSDYISISPRSSNEIFLTGLSRWRKE